MKVFLSVICILGCSYQCFSQNIERKIIIQNNSFFYTTINEEFQVGTLHTGSFSQPLKTEKKLALPAGRNFNEPLNPFSWDLMDSLMYAVNFLDHPLNSKKDALKCFNLSSLHEWNDSITLMQMIMEGIEQNRFAYNEPYTFTIHHSKYINGFYFDAIVLQDSSYFMIIANNNEVSIWNYIHHEWTHSEIQTFNMDGLFSLFEINKLVYVILNNGNIHRVSKNEIAKNPVIITDRSLNENILILNRDENTVQLIKNNELNSNIPLNTLMKEKGIYIF